MPTRRSNRTYLPRFIACLVLLLVLSGCSKDDEVPAVALGISDMDKFPSYRSAEVGWASSDGKVLSGTLSFPRSPGSYPAVMFHFGSNKWSRQDIGVSFIRRWVDAGFVVFIYDKRGGSRSQGECCPWQDPDYFPLLGDDVLFGIRTIAQHPEIRADAIGAYGFSQGGWIIPTAAANSTEDIAFTVIGSGPTVTLGEELLYSQLTGENDCEATNISQEDIATQLDAAGQSGFDPYPYINDMTKPGLWVYGENDLSVPVVQCTEILDKLITLQNKPFDYWILDNANHSWIVDGGICQTIGGTSADPFQEIFDWINDKIN